MTDVREDRGQAEAELSATDELPRQGYCRRRGYQSR
jgi:hypothetical protein